MPTAAPSPCLSSVPSAVTARAAPGPWQPLHCCRNSRGSLAWLHEVKDACVRAPCSAAVTASANPDTLVTQTQPESTQKCHVGSAGVGGSSKQSHPCSAVLQIPSAGPGEGKSSFGRFLLLFPFLPVLLPFPQPGHPSWDGHSTAPSLWLQEKQAAGL